MAGSCRKLKRNQPWSEIARVEGIEPHPSTRNGSTSSRLRRDAAQEPCRRGSSFASLSEGSGFSSRYFE
jgi:hypothetical protein